MTLKTQIIKSANEMTLRKQLVKQASCRRPWRNTLLLRNLVRNLPAWFVAKHCQRILFWSNSLTTIQIHRQEPVQLSALTCLQRRIPRSKRGHRVAAPIADCKLWCQNQCHNRWRIGPAGSLFISTWLCNFVAMYIESSSFMISRFF